jgi:hypothetical protein
LDANFVADGAIYNKKQVLIQYPHLPSLQYFAPATVTVMKGDIQAKVKKVGYIEGAGDFIPEFLRIAGIQVDVLKDEDFYGSIDESGKWYKTNCCNMMPSYLVFVPITQRKSSVAGCLFYGLM